MMLKILSSFLGLSINTDFDIVVECQLFITLGLLFIKLSTPALIGGLMGKAANQRCRACAKIPPCQFKLVLLLSPLSPKAHKFNI